MSSNIFVALWSRDTARATLSENIGTRLYYLEEAVQKSWDKYKANQRDYKGEIHAIFLAPEYLFTNPRDESQEGKVTRAISEPTKRATLSMLGDVSRKYTGLLFVPGTISYSLDEAKYPVTFKESRDKALGQMKTMQTGMPQRVNQTLKNLSPPGQPVPSLTQKIEMLEKSDHIDYIIRNKMYIFLNGKVVAKYGKKADRFEATGDVPGVYIPGQNSGLADIGGIHFGFEICYDHEIGVLKNLSGAKAVDIHMIASAEVSNSTANMLAKVGGFVIHASSNRGYTAVYYKPTPAWKSSHGKFQGAYATEKEAVDIVEIIGSEEVAGALLKYYVLTLE